MALTTKDFSALVRDQATAIQGAARTLLDFSIGSVLRAIVEANAGIAMWLQGLILQLLATTRAATSTGGDLDSFVNDFGVTRLAGYAASGNVTFSRFTPTNSAFIPVGTKIQTSDQSPEIFAVTADTTNAAYSATLGGYTIPAGASLLSVPVVASQVGIAGNVAIGQCNVLTSAIPGVDSVTNAAAFTNGADPETDAALRARFVNYLTSLAKATTSAVGYAITSVQSGLSYTLTENPLSNGVPQYGNFAVVIDDGSGNPPGPLLAAVNNAIDAVRPVGTAFTVSAPVKIFANVNMTIAAAPGYSKTALMPQVAAALTSYINGIPLGQPLPYTRLAQIAWDTSPGIANVTGVALTSPNGTINAAGDLTVTAQQVVKASTISVN